MTRADHHLCVVCGEHAYDPTDHEDSPWAPSRDGDGVVCCANCAMAEAMDGLTGFASVEALRAALDDGADVELVRLVLTRGAGDVVGQVVSHDADGVCVEDAACDEHLLAWFDIREAELIHA